MLDLFIMKWRLESFVSAQDKGEKLKKDKTTKREEKLKKENVKLRESKRKLKLKYEKIKNWEKLKHEKWVMKKEWEN